MTVITADPRLAMPRWPYRLGRQTEADHDTLAKAKALVPIRYVGFVPARDPALRYGLALNDASFFWESHEILEAVWKVAPQRGRDRLLLRACIQVANANLKTSLQRPRAAHRLLQEAQDELHELSVRLQAGDVQSFSEYFPIATLSAAIADRLATNDADCILIDITGI
jgi:predicted metal-dependent hydrolase